jgi:predicted DNA-binding transcriptional regulator YafY
MHKWPRDRLTLALQLLVALPAHPTTGVRDLIAELECSKGAFYRILADLRAAGFGIGKQHLPDGQPAYFVTRHDQALIDRIMRLGRVTR